jgi:hypothetical protein
MIPTKPIKFESGTKILQSALDGMQSLRDAYKCFGEAWELASDADVLGKFEEDICTDIRQVTYETSTQSWDEACSNILQVKEAVQEADTDFEDGEEIAQRTIDGLDFLYEAFKGFWKAWDDACDADVLELFDGVLCDYVREATAKAQDMSWDEACSMISDYQEKMPQEQLIAHDKYLDKLWIEMTKQSFTNDEYDSDDLDAEFYIWSKGTPINVIWHWFTEQHTKDFEYLLNLT